MTSILQWICWAADLSKVPKFKCFMDEVNLKLALLDLIKLYYIKNVISNQDS